MDVCMMLVYEKVKIGELAEALMQWRTVSLKHAPIKMALSLAGDTVLDNA